MIDEHGFIHLTRKDGFDLDGLDQTTERKKTSKKKTAHKPKKIKFKKGKWKYELFKRLSSWASSIYSVNFHFVKMENYFVHTEKGRQICTPTKEWISKSVLKKSKSDKSAFVMINSYDDVFTKVSVKTYMKLMKINRLIIDFQLFGSYDGTEEYNVYSDTTVIDNVNDLLHYVNRHRQSIDGIYDIESYCCGYTTHRYDFRILVQYQNGEVKTYHSDMNDFMKDHGLYLF